MSKFFKSLIIVFLSFIIACNSYRNEQSKGFKMQKDSTQISKKKSHNLPFKSPPLSDTVIFAGENVPVNDVSVMEALDRELIVNNYFHSRTFLAIKRSGRWFPMIERILRKNDIPEDFKYMAVAESALENVVSYKNAVGYWQLLERTAEDFGLEVNRWVDERYHVKKSTKVACQYLKDAHKDLGSWALAAAAYNRGKKGIQDQLDAQQVNSYYDLELNNETARYVFRLIATKMIFENPQSYGFNIDPKNYYKSYKTRALTINSTIGNLKSWAREKGTTYKNLKTLNPWIIRRKLPCSGNNSYQVKLPASDSQLKIHSDQ